MVRQYNLKAHAGSMYGLRWVNIKQYLHRLKTNFRHVLFFHVPDDCRAISKYVFNRSVIIHVTLLMMDEYVLFLSYFSFK